MKVILFNPRSYERTARPESQSFPIRCWLWAPCSKTARVSYRIIDGNLEVDPVGAIEVQIERDRETLLAVTVMPGPQLKETVLCTGVSLPEGPPSRPDNRVGRLLPFPALRESCLRSDFVDYVVRGHGEKVFLHLLEELSAGRPLERAPGIAFREEATG